MKSATLSPTYLSGASRDLVRLGFATAVAQVVLLREAMAALTGSELAWGAILGLWLVGMGAGSRAGVRLDGPLNGRAAPALTLLLAAAGAVVLRAAPMLAGAAAGEVLGLWHTAWIWLLAVLPSAFCGGLGFPVLAGTVADAGRAYSAEALGAFVGGLLFSCLLAPLGTTMVIGLSLAPVTVTALWPRGPGRALVFGLLMIVIAIVADTPLARATWRWQQRPGQLQAWAETRHQRLEVSNTDPLTLYSGGSVIASYPDHYVAPLRAHLIMLLHPRPARVFACASTADGTLETLLLHPLERLVVVEHDPGLLRLLPKWYGEKLAHALADPRVHPLTTDPLHALRRSRDLDLILLLGPDPGSLRRNRTRTVNFFEESAQRLAPGGMVVVNTGINDTYLGGARGRLLQVLIASLSEVFTTVYGVPGEHILLIGCSEPTAPGLEHEVLVQRWQQRAVNEPRYSVAELLPSMLDSGRRQDLGLFINQSTGKTNTATTPRAVLLAASLAEGRGAPPVIRSALYLEARAPWLLAILLIAAVTAVILAPRRHAATPVAAVVGFSSMSWWLILLSSWQATRGSVYAEVGALTGVLMGGLALGAHYGCSRNLGRRSMPWLLAAGALLSAALATGASLHLPWLSVTLMLLAAGAFTGVVFPGLADLAAAGQPRRGAGIAFAADEVGAAAAAVAVGLFALPTVGMVNTALGLVVLQGAAVVAAVRAHRDRP